MKRNLTIIALTVAVLLLITFLALHLHRQSKREVLKEFDAHQLDVARQVAREIESHLHAYTVCMQMVASFASLQHHDRKQMATDIGKSFEYMRTTDAQAISVYDEKGGVVYSTEAGEIGLIDGRAAILGEARKWENKGKVFVFSLNRRGGGERSEKNAPARSEGLEPPHFRFHIVVPLYQEASDVRYPKPSHKFVGILSLKADLEKLLAEHLLFIRPKIRLHQVWLMDREGTLLFQSEHPEMGLRDIYHRDHTCHQCHISFDYAERMVIERQGTSEYQVRGYPKKLAAFAPMDFANASWIVVVNAPYQKAVAFTTKSSRDTLWLLGVIGLALLGGSALVCRDYRLKVRAEEETKQWREKRALEDRIRESEERYRHLVELSPDAVAVHCEGQIVFINTAGANLLRAATPDELIGKSIIDFVHPDYLEVVKGRIDEMKGEGKKVPLIEEKFIRLDGTLIDVEVAASPFTYQGKPGMQVVFRDVTERKRVEEKIRTLNEDLTHRTIELETSNKELEAFSYSASHDLRNPLLVIEGFSRLLLEKYLSCLDQKGQHYLTIIKEKTRDMGQLIEDLLAFSRSGRQGIVPSEINMVQLAESVFEELKKVTSAPTPQLTIKHFPPAYGDPAMIRQAFINLLSNAIKFTRQRRPGMIEIGCRTEEGEDIYYIKDNGVGFDMQNYDKLFEVFQRLHTPEEFEGTGVGLATVQRIIQRHGGRVWAEGEVNGGAIFYLTLPAHPLPCKRE